MEQIQVYQATEHNLKHVDLTIPRDKLVVFTGVSGSGKSSLAFDTIFAEGQRRYLESMSSYARQYVEQLEKPKVEQIDGLSPAISIDQKSASRSPRSTVGTVTEILDYLRLLYARIGVPHCPQCGLEISAQSLQRIVQKILDSPEGTRLQILSPVVRGRKGEYRALFEQLRKEGWSRVQVDGETHLLEELPEDYRLEKTKTHRISVVIDRVVVNADDSLLHRVTQSVETALKKADGFIILENVDAPDLHDRAVLYSLQLACPQCDTGYDELAPRMFSFNSPYGACAQCEGLGMSLEITEQRLVPDDSVTLEAGAIAPFQKVLGKYYKRYLKGIAAQFRIRKTVPYNKLTEREKTALLYGDTSQHALIKAWSDDVAFSQPATRERDDDLWEDFATAFDGVIPMLRRRYLYGSPAQKQYIQQYMEEATCSVCHGKRLKPISLGVTLGGYSIHDLGELSIQKAHEVISGIYTTLSAFQLTVGREPLYEVQSRLKFLLDVGLDYLTLNRRAATLSGGEAQRIRLASQIGSQLSGVLYVLDEPSIGLHPYNNTQLIQTMKQLRDLGNSLIVVEHDEETMREADWIVDIGPGAGRHGGTIVASGPYDVITKDQNSLTAQYLTGQRQMIPPQQVRSGLGQVIRIEGATLHNLKNIRVDFPLGTLIGVTGLSGSGKSTLVFDLLYGILHHHFGKFQALPSGFQSVSGLEHLDKFIHIDQSPIGRTPRSNPATYTGIFDTIRNVFAKSEEAKIKGFGPGHFSFNVAQGRCPQCKGDGMIRLEMNFLPDVYTPCESCNGKRYNLETLSVEYRGKTIADVLAMTVEEALVFFEDISQVARQLEVLNEVGLGYISLGQPATTLSGGEAQRVKLATEFCKRSTGKTIYLLDEPTIGLHWRDLENLLYMLNKLVDAGNTVVVIEHNMDLIKMTDHVIDLGPEGGERGGEIVATGSPRQVAQHATSYTAQYLQPFFMI